MRLSDLGRQTLKRLEGTSQQAYQDSGGVLTIGVGHALTRAERLTGRLTIRGFGSVPWKAGLGEALVEELLTQDLAAVEQAVSTRVRVPLTQTQYDALVIFVFNVGISAFREGPDCDLLVALNQGHYDAIPGELRRWVYDGGQRIQGLANRREAEIGLWGMAA